MFTTVTPDVVAKLCCPFCKAPIEPSGVVVCGDCGSTFSPAHVDTGAGVEQVLDLRLPRRHLKGEATGLWDDVQARYESFTDEHAARDDLGDYLTEIDSVTEIYADFFSLEGEILDVGGHQGRLRHFIPPAARRSYVSADPFVDVFEHIGNQPALLKAYPALNEPCNFVGCHAEHLPFFARSFDRVHMRSVLDHFYDPYLALKEGYRVLRPGGELLVGLTVEDPPTGPIKTARDEDHMTHWRQGDVREALRVAGFELEEEHWQKPPYSMCLYISARRPA